MNNNNNNQKNTNNDAVSFDFTNFSGVNSNSIPSDIAGLIQPLITSNGVKQAKSNSSTTDTPSLYLLFVYLPFHSIPFLYNF